MATAPGTVEIRSYQVGFGDCFLLSFVYSATNKKHVLIDFGTTELPSKGGVKIKPSDHMARVANDIKQVCNSNLTAVVATHRHADHISGFATDAKSGGSGTTIAQCKPKLVLQPWTEDPSAAKNATHATTTSLRSPKSFVTGLAAMNNLAEHVTQLVQSKRVPMSESLAKRLTFLGMDNIANRSAIDNLIAMGKSAKAVFANEGSDSGLDGLLPGVKVTVLGPPDLTQSESIKKMRSSDPDEFWQLVGGEPMLRALTGAATASHSAKPKPGKSAAVPPEARWFIDRLESLTNAQLLEIVRSLDQQMNNTSLILLFEINGKKLLFPGDAQLENWSWALRDSPGAANIRKKLADVDVYKVGHHGSRNATPRQLLWENFSKRNASGSKRLVSFLSTLPGKHGHASSKTEVPRKTLLTALQGETVLHDTESLTWGKTPTLCAPITIPL